MYSIYVFCFNCDLGTPLGTDWPQASSTRLIRRHDLSRSADAPTLADKRYALSVLLVRWAAPDGYAGQCSSRRLV